MNKPQHPETQNRREAALPAPPYRLPSRANAHGGAALQRVPPFGQARLRSAAILLIATLIGLASIAAAYRHTRAYAPAIESWSALGTGLHAVETSGESSYVYTTGRATLRFPEVGRGMFETVIRAGGIPGSGTASTQLAASDIRLELGTLNAARSYHALLPATRHGDLVISINSPARIVPPDIRPLGILLLDIAVQPAGSVSLPWPVALTTLITLALLWLTLWRLGVSPVWRGLALAACAAVIAASLALWRGTIVLQPLWLGIALIGLAALWLVDLPTRPRLHSLRGTLLLMGGWRIALWILAGLGLWYGRDLYRYGHGNAIHTNETVGGHARLLWRALTEAWLKWDSDHYVAIAEIGYTFWDARWPTVAFFPLYPLLIRLFETLTLGHAGIAALLVSHAALVCALLLLFNLVAHDFGAVVAQRSVLLLLAFPTAFFFVAGYNESLALTLAVASVWAIRRQRWWLAGCAGLLLAMTRIPGVFMSPVIALCYLQQQRWRWRAIRWPLLAAALPPLGLALFMAYQWLQFDTPWAFMMAQVNWNNGAAMPSAIPKRIWRSLTTAPDWEMALLQGVVWSGVLVLTLLALWRLPLAYGLTGFLLLFPAYTADQRISLIRHVLIGFPAFVLLARLPLPLWLRWLILTLMLSALALQTMLFVNGFFVA